MATASFVDEHGNSVTAVSTFESGQTILRLTRLGANGKTIEKTKRFSRKISINDALAMMDVVVDGTYGITITD